MTFEDIMDQELVPNAPMRAQWYDYQNDRLTVLYESDWSDDRVEKALEGSWFVSWEICEIFPDGDCVVFELSED